jgi:hypothetical protein
MFSGYEREHASDWSLSRRNLIAICGILAGSLLSSCKGGTQIWSQDDNDDRPNCYLEGTRILTPEGERLIQELAIGDPVITSVGIAKSIKWISRRHYARPQNRPWAERIRPVRFARSALQNNIPNDDLFVSQDHCLYLDGMLIRATNLVNGSSIRVDPLEGCTDLNYLHVVLDEHDIILAQGAACETLLLDHVGQRFDNYADYERLYGAAATVAQQLYTRIYSDFGRRQKVYSHLRSALSPVIDRRTTFDKLRDRLMRNGVSSLTTVR